MSPSEYWALEFDDYLALKQYMRAVFSEEKKAADRANARPRRRR